ncbi:MAG: UDP-3-O-[3-hydroxymyristoyl] N-acetylglucosamine deacetylase [Lentisphaerae bacterium]|nr:UDP-3-O-[3-hydroxymyristoyl] N-acetylglucosamine deacetylase [Lentisphaerota bacterium]
MNKQQTLREIALFSGIALHTGVRSTLRFLPAEINSGIVFRRVDLPGKPEVAALASKVVDVRRGTTIGEGACVAHTVEHIMAALHAMQIDNCVIEMDGPEPPIADGSSLPFWEVLKAAGTIEQDAEAKYFNPSRALFVDAGVTSLVLLPNEQPELRVSCTTSFKGCPIDPQFLDIVVTAGSFDQDICGARTFVDYRDLGALIAMGLCKGGSLDNAEIIHDGAIVCKDGLRYENEIVRHKILDLIGDLYLCGRRVNGHVIAVKPGHHRNTELAASIMQEIAKQQ